MSTFSGRFRGLDPQAVRIGIMDGLPGLENLFKKVFPKSITQRCWVHAKKNAIAKCPKRFLEAFETAIEGMMYASSENRAREEFGAFKSMMQKDGERAVACIEKDFEALIAHYKFEKRFWISLKTTNPIERINKEFKRRIKPMEHLGERTLKCVLVFTALRLESEWKKNPIDSKHFTNLKNVGSKVNAIEQAVETLLN